MTFTNADRRSFEVLINGRFRAATTAALLFALSGCSAVDNLVNPTKPVVVRLEVWNRTLDAIFLVDQDGQRLDVPACGHAVAPQFHMNRYEVRTEEGYFFGGGTSGVGDTGRGQTMVIVATPGDPMQAGEDPAALPPCEGHPEVKQGV